MIFGFQNDVKNHENPVILASWGAFLQIFAGFSGIDFLFDFLQVFFFEKIAGLSGFLASFGPQAPDFPDFSATRDAGGGGEDKPPKPALIPDVSS